MNQTDKRKLDFKKSFSGESKRARNEKTLTLRKIKREENFKRKRNMKNDEDEESVSLDMLPAAVEAMNKNENNIVLEGIKVVRMLLSLEDNPPIELIVKNKILPRIIQLLSSEDHKIQFEALWAITNVVCGSSDEVTAVLEGGAVEPILKLLSHPDPDIRDQAVWAIGNIAGDCFQFRDYILGYDTMNLLIEYFKLSQNIQMIRQLTWTISNLCRGVPPPPWEKIKPALPLVANLLKLKDKEVTQDACWALSYMSDGDEERITSIMTTEVCPILVELLKVDVIQIRLPILRIIGNIITGNDEQTEYMLNLNILPTLKILLQSDHKLLCKEACWTLSNITAGTLEQVKRVINEGIFPIIIQLLYIKDPDIKKEAVWVLSNSSACCDKNVVHYLVEQGIIEPLISLLDFPDLHLIMSILEALQNILTCGHDDTTNKNLYSSRIEACHGIEKIEDLQKFNNEIIYSKAVQLLEAFFNGVEMDKD